MREAKKMCLSLACKESSHEGREKELAWVHTSTVMVVEWRGGASCCLLLRCPCVFEEGRGGARR